VSLPAKTRVGRALEQLFDADRASLLTELMHGVITEFGIDTAELHNDSTSISVHGVYRSATGTPRGGKPTPAITFGHSKDHRPDLKQLVFILTVASDGAVPIAYRLAEGNTNDDRTHVPTWDGLVTLLGRSDFVYVADSKLCSGEAMGHIAAGGGRFVTVLPRSRSEDRWFRDWAQTYQPQWAEAERHPGPRLGEPDQVYSTFPAPLPSTEGYRIVWVHSTAKAAADAAARQARMEAAIDTLATRLAGPKCRLKTRVAVDEEAVNLLDRAGASRCPALGVGLGVPRGHPRRAAAARYARAVHGPDPTPRTGRRGMPDPPGRCYRGWFCRSVPTADVRQGRPHPGSRPGPCSRVPTAPRPSSVQAASPSTRSGSTWSARSRQARTNDVDPRRATATMAATEEGVRPAPLRSVLDDIDHERDCPCGQNSRTTAVGISPTKPRGRRRASPARRRRPRPVGGPSRRADPSSGAAGRGHRRPAWRAGCPAARRLGR
jgi:hypothetical protein